MCFLLVQQCAMHLLSMQHCSLHAAEHASSFYYRIHKHPLQSSFQENRHGHSHTCVLANLTGFVQPMDFSVHGVGTGKTWPGKVKGVRARDDIRAKGGQARMLVLRLPIQSNVVSAP